MGGTKYGGKKASETNRERYGEDFYAKIGAIGGKKSRTGGFASNLVGEDGLTGKERARVAGHKGGSISKKSSSKGDTNAI